MTLRRAKAEAANIERMQRNVDADGRRLLMVRAAESTGFWYTANFEGFGGGDPWSRAPPCMAVMKSGFRSIGRESAVNLVDVSTLSLF